MACKCNHNIKLALLACFGIVLGLLGGILYAVFPRIYKDQIAKKAALIESNTKTFDAWKSPPVPVNFKLHFFNLTNPDDYRNNDSIPILKQVGPYVFKEKQSKDDILFSDSKNSVWYRNKKVYVFDPEASSGSIDDKITTLNVPLVGIAHRLQNFPLLLKTVASALIATYGEELLVTKTVSELSLDGYKDPLMEFIQTHTGLIILPNATFGLFYDSKHSPGDYYKINTGKDDSKKLAMIEEWSNKTKLTYWKSKYCNMLNGTDGTMFPPSVEIDKVLYIFSTDLCRSLYLGYEKDIENHDITTYRFIAPENLFADPKTYARNKCYCTKEPCFGKGLLDVSSCKKGAPVVLSAPHFYQADQKYIDAVEGLSPKKELHETFIDVEPNTGVVLQAAKRIQINIHVKPNPGVKNMGTVEEIVYPVVWVEEGARIDDDSAEKFKDAVFKPKRIIHAVVISLVTIGCLLLTISVIFVVYIYKKNTTAQTRTRNGEDNYRITSTKTKQRSTLNGEDNLGMKHIAT